MVDKVFEIKQESVFVVSIKTSGFDPEKDEVIMMTVGELNRLKPDPHKIKTWLIKPQQSKISPDAKVEFNLNHDECSKIMMEGESLAQVKKEVESWIGDCPVVMHGTFVEEFAPWITRGRLCINSLRLVKHIWPKGSLKKGFQLETHKIAELKYWLGLEPDVLSQDPTQPMAEAMFFKAVLGEAVKSYLKQKPDHLSGTWGDVKKFEMQRIAYPRVPYGMHSGKEWSEMAQNWLEKELGKETLEDDIRMAIQDELDRRMDQVVKNANEHGLFRPLQQGGLFSKL